MKFPHLTVRQLAIGILLTASVTHSAVVLPSPVDDLTVARAINSWECGYEMACKAPGFTTDEVAKLDEIIHNIPDNGVLSTTCKVIDCVGNLCAYPLRNGYNWTMIQQGASLITSNCGANAKQLAIGHGCGASKDPSNDEKHVLRFGWVENGQNKPGGFPGEAACGSPRSGVNYDYYADD